MKLIWRLMRRDFSLMAARPAEWLMPLTFFLLVALLLPFAIGPEPRLLARLAPGIRRRSLRRDGRPMKARSSSAKSTGVPSSRCSGSPPASA